MSMGSRQDSGIPAKLIGLRPLFAISYPLVYSVLQGCFIFKVTLFGPVFPNIVCDKGAAAAAGIRYSTYG